jgi:CubicO group peptidase (beta-lactamase class C family)
MRTLLRAFTLALPIAAAIGAVGSPPSIPDSGKAALARFLAASVDRGDVPAVAAIVVDRDSMLYGGAFGKRDVAGNKPATPQTIFRIASMTKPVTSLAVMMLNEEGKVGLDDPVMKYLPEFVNIRTLAGRPPKRRVTVRDLLTHTSGIGYAFSDERLARLDTGGKPVVELPLLHEPGAKFTYGQNTAVLGQIVEKVSGQPLDTFVKARIFDPLGMSDTAYVVAADQRDRVATQHQRGSDGVLTERPNPADIRSPVRGDGGLFSTTGDYAAFMQLFLNGGRHGERRLVGERTLAMMMSNQIGRLTVVEQPTADPARAKPFPIGAGKDTFGFGFQIETAPSDPSMRSVGSVSWGGIYNTHFWIDPRRHIAAVVLMQLLPYYDEASMRMLRGFERLVYQELR